MQIIDTPLLAPGCCAFTGTSEGQLLDLEQDISRLGRAYLSLELCGEIAEAIGAASPQRVAQLEAENELLRARVDELVEGEDSVHAAYDRLRASLAETLQHGLVIDKRGAIRLRPARGQKVVHDGSGDDVKVPAL